MMDARINAINEQLVKLVEKHLKHDQSTFNTELHAKGLDYFGKKFAGVFAADQIPRLPFGHYAIANLDKSNQPGSHWIALARSPKHYIVYDSFGRNTKKILPTLTMSNIQTDNDAEQSPTEDNCGQRCLAWLLLFDNWGQRMAMKL
jgi:hypothetical protein